MFSLNMDPFGLIDLLDKLENEPLHYMAREKSTFYGPPMKLREGNIFSHARLSTVGSHVTITYYALDLTIQGLPKHVQNYSTWTSLYRPPALTPALAPALVQLASGRFTSYWNGFFFL